MAHLGRVTETMTTRTVGLTREQVAAWHDATWTDTTTPRTERPVRFYPKGRPAPYPGPTDVCVEQAYGTSFRVSDAIRVF